MDQTRIIYAATALQNFDMMDGLEPEDYIEREEDAFSVYEKLEREQLLALADVWIGDKIGKDLRDEIAHAVYGLITLNIGGLGQNRQMEIQILTHDTSINSGLLTNNYITIDTYANIFSDEPDAGRMILPATSSLNIFA
ncbi:hypothetical protein E4U38_003343 [Claviceps purpurea]|nr:hypothetical protein E4U38_003343 [Claviceps purpurea]KAG6241201.1 hypothetical protein E4U25_006741 [Claviceps purpurea]